jgi:ubiquinone/menaquinone biosynthesis C-methylase UbiE
VQRQLTPEFLDDPALPAAELRQIMAMVRLINRRLGGVEALLGHLRTWSKGWTVGRTVTLLDVATGSADVPLQAVRWAEESGFTLRVTAIDRSPGVLEIAREHVGAEPRIEVVSADARSIPDQFGPHSFDYVHAGLFLHHLDNDTAIAVLQAMDRVAREGIVWNDLLRSRRGVAGGHVLGFGRPRAVRHDIVASLRAGFTRAEVQAMAKRAGLDYTSYHENFLAQRFTLAGLRPGPERRAQLQAT